MGNAPLIVELDGQPITWARFTADLGDDALAGLSEWVVNGPADVQFPGDPPQAPTDLALSQNTLQARWRANAEPNLAGYKVHYGLTSGVYTATLDVGDVTSFWLRGLQDGVKYFVAVSAYTHTGVDGAPVVDGALSEELSGVAHWPVVQRITPERGSIYGDTLVTIQGAYFHKEARVLIGGQPALDVRWRDARTIIAFTAASYLAGPVDVLVVNPDGSMGKLAGAFSFTDEPLAESPTPTATRVGTATRPPAPPTATSTPILPTASPSRTLVIWPTATLRETPTPFPTLTWTPTLPLTTKKPPTPTPRR
jgi:hypothetical protein